MQLFLKVKLSMLQYICLGISTTLMLSNPGYATPGCLEANWRDNEKTLAQPGTGETYSPTNLERSLSLINCTV